MSSKQQRLCEVYTYLRDNGKVHTQVGFASAVRVTRAAISAALNGNEAYLTKNLFQKICGAFPGVFNIDYLLTGEGQLLANNGTDTSEPSPEQPKQPASGGDLFAQMVADLRKDLDYFKKMVLAKDNIIQDNTGQLISLQSRLAAATAELEMVKADVHHRDQIIDTLKSELEYHRKRPFDAHPFPLGVAEGDNEHIPIASDE